MLTEEFNNNKSVIKKNIKFVVSKKDLNGKKLKIFGIEID